MRLFRHTLTQRLMAVGSDEVIGHCPIPGECSLNNVWGECHIVGTSNIDAHEAVLYGVDGRVITDKDPGDAAVLDTQWDQQTIKDADVGSGAFTMDPGTSQSGPMFEPGEPSLEGLMDMSFESDENEFFKRRKMISFISTPRGFQSGTPDIYLPGDVFKIRSGKKISVEVMSNAVLVVSAPSMDDVTTTAATTFSSEAKWMQMKYMEVVLEQAWMELLGLVEAGAETPWEDAALLVEEVLEPTVIEETAGTFNDFVFNAFCAMTFDVTVPGRFAVKAISAA